MPHLACPLLAKRWKNIAQLFAQRLLLAGQLQKNISALSHLTTLP